MFTPEESAFRIYPQSAFQVDDVGTPSGKILPASKNFQVKRTRNPLTNDQQQADGFEREFGNGNWLSRASGTLVCNLNFIGYLLKAISKTFTPVAFSGVYATAITAGGTGYTAPFLVTYTGGVGTGASGLAVVLGGTVIAVVMLAHGTGYTSDPTPDFSAGAGTGATGTASRDATKYTHTGLLGSGAPVYWTLEKYAGTTLWRRYFNMQLSKLTLASITEGLCNVDTEWVGSGHWKKAGTALDGAAAEVTGTPGEYANLSIVEGGNMVGIVDGYTATIDQGVKEKRPPGYAGKAMELRKGGVMVSLDGTAWYENETLADKQANGTITEFRSVLTTPDGILEQIYPESKMEVEDWERQDDGVMLPFKAHSVKKTSGDAPAKFILINGTATY